MQVIQHFNIQTSKKLFHHPRYGIVEAREGLRADEAETFGFRTVLVYSLDFEGYARPYVQTAFNSSPLDPLGFLQRGWEIWRREPFLSGAPDLLKINEKIAKAFPQHLDALTHLGVSWVIGSGKDRKFTSRVNVGDRYAVERLGIGDEFKGLKSKSLCELNADYVDGMRRFTFLEEEEKSYRTAVSSIASDRRGLVLQEGQIEEEIRKRGIQLAPLDRAAFWIGQSSIPPRQFVDVSYYPRDEGWAIVDTARWEIEDFERINLAGKIVIVGDDEKEISDGDESDDEFNDEEDEADSEDGSNAEYSEPSPYSYLIREALKPLLRTSPFSMGEIAKMAELTLQELRWFMSERAALRDWQLHNLQDIFGFEYNEDHDAYEPNRPLIVLPQNKKSAIDSYIALSFGDPAICNEVLPESAEVDPEYRYLLFRPFSQLRYCHVMLFERSSQHIDLLERPRDRSKSNGLDVGNWVKVSDHFYRELVVYCRAARSHKSLDERLRWWLKYFEEVRSIEDTYLSER